MQVIPVHKKLNWKKFNRIVNHCKYENKIRQNGGKQKTYTHTQRNETKPVKCKWKSAISKS